ncbi:hypothetical protein SH580_02880 [Coraliomargarita algicola]|uniref:Uncharacterized protein n=1 Tax=Coraliomargarita algicola TaxID=3092156 RepID=A0ABZ0RML8_9BACT|nr:hypothetical protein [Coraliomargarita sp. J2-16]WPJ96646.1 hypothetical protein SH580_02880 [Coraliomargarita sp. J2-16]
MMQSYISEIRGGLLDWMESVRYEEAGWGRWKYHSMMERPYALNASGIAIKILHRLGLLDQISAAQRREAVEYFKSCQDSSDGLFRDPLELEADRIGSHSWESIWGQRNGVALEAIEYLHSRPDFPEVKAQFVNLREVDTYAWTLSLDWSNPWMHGESWSRAISAFLKTANLEKSEADRAALDGMFQAVEQHLLDPETGFPLRLGCKDASVGMAGLFKLMFGYLDAGRVVPHAEKAIDSTLLLQNENGEFGAMSNMCFNWDSLWVLRELDLQLEGRYRHVEIVAAGNRLASVLLSNYRKEDGGFSFNGALSIQEHHGVRLSAQSHPIGDMLAAIMVLYCFEYCDEWNSGSLKLINAG